MKEARVKVTLEYYGHLHSPTTHEYKITKIFGSPTVRVSVEGGYKTARVGDFILESQAEELASTVQVDTVPKQQ